MTFTEAGLQSSGLLDVSLERPATTVPESETLVLRLEVVLHLGSSRSRRVAAAYITGRDAFVVQGRGLSGNAFL